MKKTIVSKPGEWGKWPNGLRESLVSAENNQQVGDRVVYENELFKVWSIHLPAGKSLPFHKHCKPYFWTVLNEGKARSYYGDGSIIDTDYKSGDTIYFKDLSDENYFIHNLENLEDKTLIFTTVEFNFFKK